jgi:prophage regulatory protein
MAEWFDGMSMRRNSRQFRSPGTKRGQADMTSAERMAKEDTPLKVRLLSDSDVSPRKPYAPIQTEDGRLVVPNAPDDVSFLRLPDVKLVTGLSKSSLYALIRAESFPAPVRLGPRTVAWVRSEVNDWAVERISTSRFALSPPGTRRGPQRALGEVWTPSRKLA